MNNKKIEEQIVGEILAHQSRQLEVDAIREAMKFDSQNIEELKNPLYNILVENSIKNYPVDIEREKEEKRKSTESFRTELKKEQEKKEKEKRVLIQKRKKQITAYTKNEVYKNELKKQTKLEEKEEKGIVEKIKDVINKIWSTTNIENNETTIKAQPTHQEFADRISYKTDKVELKGENKKAINKEKGR